MSHIVKVIEVLAESKRSWEDAANNALQEARRTLRNIRSVYVQHFEAKVEEGQITRYRVNAKISFDLESVNENGEQRGKRKRLRKQGVIRR